MKEKYGGPRGMFSQTAIVSNSDWPQSQMLESLKNTVVTRLNCSIAQGTWSQYGTAVTHLSRCGKDTGIAVSYTHLTLPTKA